MLQAIDLQPTTSQIDAEPSKRSIESASGANYSPMACEISSRFDNISAKIQSDSATLGQVVKKEAVGSAGSLEGAAPDDKEAWKPALSAERNAEKGRIHSADLVQPVLAQVGAKKAGDKEDLRSSHWKFFGESVNQDLKVDEVVEKLESGKLWVVNSRRRNGLIVLREFHAEFAGPGAAVGGDLDSEDIIGVIPIGNLSLLSPDSHEAHQNAIKIRLQWIRLTQNFTDQPRPDDRARMILEQFKTYFDQATVDLVPDQAFALLVGVLPRTIRRVRSGFVW